MADNSNGEHSSLADRFLRDAQVKHQHVAIYLVNGFQLKGEIVEADRDTILFKHRDVYQFIIRTAVATMYPIPDRGRQTDGWWSEYVSTVMSK